jgi:hypothetical protein
MKKLFICLYLITVTGCAQAMSAADMVKMMDEVRSIVTKIGTNEDVQNFDNQMSEAQQLKNESAARQAETARTRNTTENSNRDIKINNEIAIFKEMTRNEQLKKNQENRSTVIEPNKFSRKCMGDCLTVDR